MLIELKVGFFHRLSVVTKFVGVPVVVGMVLWNAARSPYFMGCSSGPSVRGNMRTVQIAAESYFTDTKKYPTDLKELEPYLPGGNSLPGGKPGQFPANAVTGDSQQPVVLRKMPSTKWIQTIRQQSVGKSGLEPGQIAYTVFNKGESYAITGADQEGFYEAGVGGTTLVLSCQ